MVGPSVPDLERPLMTAKALREALNSLAAHGGS
jgi:hypothetical protein